MKILVDWLLRDDQKDLFEFLFALVLPKTKPALRSSDDSSSRRRRQ